MNTVWRREFLIDLLVFVSQYIPFHEPEQISELFGNCIDIIRYIERDMQQAEVSLELGYLQKYLDILSIRYNLPERIEVTCTQGYDRMIPHCYLLERVSQQASELVQNSGNLEITFPGISGMVCLDFSCSPAERVSGLS